MRRLALVLVLLASLASLAPAAGAPPVRGLTPEEVADLRAGRGMGLARAADENGYPGPRHVLDAAQAGQLVLRPEQITAVRAVFDAMAADARRLGERILTEEAALEASFRTGTADEPDLRGRLERLAALRAELRFVHLRAHLATRPLLDESQRRRYEALRGRGSGHAH